MYSSKDRRRIHPRMRFYEDFLLTIFLSLLHIVLAFALPIIKWRERR